MKKTAIGVTGLLLLGLMQAAPQAAPEAAPAPAAPPYDTQTFAGGLDNPAGFTFAPDGRVFYGERDSGQIRILSADGNDDDLFFTVPNVQSPGEDGLLNIELHPDYPTTPYVYAYVTRNDGGAKNQIVRVTDNAGIGESMSVIFESDKAPGEYHDGGRILFGPDDKLYAIVGDRHDPDNAQDKTTDTGKILRMNDNGSAPNDNPQNGRRWFATGIRNSFGFAFDPQTGRLWESENGPSCNDELNRIPMGRNMGWGPNQDCFAGKSPRNTNNSGRKPMLPRMFFKSPPAVTGVAFCDGCGLIGGNGRLFLAAWNTGHVRRVRLDGKRRNVESSTMAYDHNQGIMSMEVAPDGQIYFSDTNGIYRLIDA